jgi:UDP-GlcNAc:undecaprenyl-phosphate GlcNAc-1-phosphate transferase
MDLLLAFILAMVLTMALIPPLMRRAGALQVLDDPGLRKVHDHPVPRVGGIAMAIGAAVPLLLWLPLDQVAVAWLAGALVVLLFGIWDDRVTLAPDIKFAGQVLAALIVVFAGGVEIHSVTLAGRIELPAWVSLPLTLLFLVGVTNAINLSDGLDGLAGGTTFLCCAAIAMLSLGTGMTFVPTVAVVIMGCLLGFLRYNSYPARVFMGDGGSQFLGFTVGVVAIQLTQQETLPYSAALPLLLLGLPILDTLAVMAIRIRERRSPFSADRNHLHHRLLGLGFEQFEAVVVIYLLQAALFLLAWQLSYYSDGVILAVFLGFAAVLLLLLLGAERRGWRWRGPGALRLRTERVSEFLLLLKQPRRMPRWTAIVAMGCTLVYFAAVALASEQISGDVAWLAVGLVTVLGLAVLQRSPEQGISALTQGALYVAVVIAVYLDHMALNWPQPLVIGKLVLFGLLTLAVVLRLRLSRERRFEVTPLDLLVIFVALALPNLPGLRGAPSNLGLSVAKLVVLFYALEMLAEHSARTRAWLRWGGIAFLGILAVRGFVLAAG